MDSIRSPAVAGTFYPAQARELARSVQVLLADASAATAELLADASPATSNEAVPKAIIAPHAGYIYSGPIAATGYSLLAQARDRIKRVVLLGPVHRVAVRGLALPDAASFATPLGNIPIDAGSVAKISNLPQVVVSSAAHALEHSLEVQLPFLQTLLAEFTLVPLAVGDATPEEVAEVLNVLWGGDETLIVISSDLSHYLNYRQAQELDRSTAQAIIDLRTDISHEQACGGTPVNGLLLATQRRGLTPRLLDLRNSGDTAGDKQHVVGYGAFAFYEKSNA